MIRIPRVTPLASIAHSTDHRHAGSTIAQEHKRTQEHGDTDTIHIVCLGMFLRAIVRIEFRAPLLGDPIEGSLLQPHPYGRGPCKVR